MFLNEFDDDGPIVDDRFGIENYKKEMRNELLI
mgnify:CR=1 FL=1